MYAKVIIEYATKELDKTFIYHVPLTLQDAIHIGMKVKVPFGSKSIYGFVLDILAEVNTEYVIKDIENIVDPDFFLNDELLKIADYLCEKTLCPKIMALQTLLPSSFKAKGQKSNYNYYETIIKLNPQVEIATIKKQIKRYPGQLAIIEKLEKEQTVNQKLINGSSLKTLLNKNIVISEKIQKYRINQKSTKKIYRQLTMEQQLAFKKIQDSLGKEKTFLLYGITGSGKTIIYLELIKEVLKNNQTALLLVPEILLTTQIVQTFYQEFGNQVAILHSGLSEGEKHDEYLKINRGEVSIVVGTRSAIFAPLKNIGIIIIDEEHSSTYKQDNTPKYQAKDIASFRSTYHHCPLVLGSATPTLESKARADKGVFELVTLTKRVGDAVLPKVTIVDMAEEMKNKERVLSRVLQAKIKDRLAKKEQIILLLNRRGYATFVSCGNCGYTYKCPNCDITLTYHASSNNLICHYCGYLKKKEKLCPNCGEETLNYLGLGTEKLEEYMHEHFPAAKVLRMDQDTTAKKGSHEKLISDFQEEKYDILIGTQMVSKGLNFPKVTLVGVINADTSLNIPDFRSSENTFQLLNQVAGRSGRSNLPGEVVIQTFNPDNYVMKCVLKSSYDAFYKQEMRIRHSLKYPPYYYLIGVKVVGKDYTKTLLEAQKVKDYLTKKVSKETIVLGPTTALILKFNNEYRFQIIIKYKFDEKLNIVLKDIDKMYALRNDVYIDIDIDPSRI